MADSQIHAGTQVVARTSIRGSGNADVHPRGAVGVVTRTPVGDETHYTVRFPDGFEASLALEQLDVLKHFKSRLGPEDSTDADFDLEKLLIYRCVVGSRAYGLDSDNSDTDRRGVYLAPAELVTPLGEDLLASRAAFLSQMIFQTFNGYALSQFKKLEQDRRNSGDVRWKHAMHLLRLLLTGAATLREGHVPVRVEGTHHDRLLAVKRGELPWPARVHFSVFAPSNQIAINCNFPAKTQSDSSVPCKLMLLLTLSPTKRRIGFHS
jgi:uncharacterized protein